VSPTPGYQFRFIISPQVLPLSPSRFHPRIALTRLGGARVKAGGAVPLAEPELSLLCSETLGKKQPHRINISMDMATKSVGEPIPPFSMGRTRFRQLGSLGRLPAGNSDRSEPNCLESDRVILRILRTIVKQILQKIPRKSNEKATGRDRAVAEWLNWLCDNGSVPGRC
jgi:hypothetical protein